MQLQICNFSTLRKNESHRLGLNSNLVFLIGLIRSLRADNIIMGLPFSDAPRNGKR